MGQRTRLIVRRLSRARKITLTANAKMVWFAMLTVSALIIVESCRNRETPSTESTSSSNQKEIVRIASWGGQFQTDLVRLWIGPAAGRANLDLRSEIWNGDYGALTTRIQRDINDYDLVHVEQFYLENPSAKQLLQHSPGRILSTLLPEKALYRDDAVPVLEYGYVLAYRADRIPPALIIPNHQSAWNALWDLRIKGERGLRDIPIGNIELALTKLNRNPTTALYATNLTHAEIEKQVDDALKELTKIRPYVRWWESGNELQRGLASGDMVMAGAWSGRVLAAQRDVCKDMPAADPKCPVQIVPSTSMVSTDWWIIPNGARHKDAANRLLQELFKESSLDGAKKFSEAQGYRAPCSNLQFSANTQYFLDIGASTPGRLRLNEKFWGENFDWIQARWRAWRLR